MPWRGHLSRPQPRSCSASATRRGGRSSVLRRRCRRHGRARTSRSSASSTTCPPSRRSGTRFAFAVERVLTPRAVVPPRLSLAWIAQPQFAPDAEAAARDPRRRALAVDRAAEAPARQRQPRRLRPRGVAAAARIPRDRVRAGTRDERAHRRVRRARVRLRAADARARARPHRARAARRAVRGRRRRARDRRPARDSGGAVDRVQPHGHRRISSASPGCTSRSSRRSRARSRSRSRAAACGSRRDFPRASWRRRRAWWPRAAYVLLAGAEIPALRTLAMVAIAAVGLWLGRPGTAGDRLAVGARGCAAVGSVGAADARLLAVVRRGGAAAVRVGRAAARRRAGRRVVARCAGTCAPVRTRNGWSRSDWCRSRWRCSSRCR